MVVVVAAAADIVVVAVGVDIVVENESGVVDNILAAVVDTVVKSFALVDVVYCGCYHPQPPQHCHSYQQCLHFHYSL